MGKTPKQETRKTVWRGISVKSDSRPSSTQSHDSSLSWEKQPLSPLSQEYSASIKTPPGTPKFEEHHRNISLQQEQQEQQEHYALDEQRHSSTISISPSNSTTVSTKSSSNSSSRHKKKKMANLGSLTKTYDPSSNDHDNDNKHSSSSQKKSGRKEGRAATLGSLTKPYEQSERHAQKEQERKERKEREKLERKAKKDQEKLDKELKEQHKKELKDQERLDKELKEQQKKELKEKSKELKLLKEKERKDRKSKTKSSIFSRSSKPSATTPTDDETVEITEDKLASQAGLRSSISFGHHSLSSHASKPSNVSNLDITVPDSSQKVFEDLDTDDSSSEEFVDFTYSHTSIQGPLVLESHEENSGASTYQHQSTQLPTPLSPTDYFVQAPLQPRPRSKTPKLSEHLHLHQQQQHTTTENQNGGTKHIDSTIQGSTNNSMFYILNSLQDAGRNIEDDDLLDDITAKKMDATQQPTRSSFSYQKHDIQGQQFDQHIQALEIKANRSSISPPPTDPLPPLPTGQRSQRQTYHFGDSRLSMDSHRSSAQQSYSSSLNGRLSISSASNNSYDTEAQTESYHSTPRHNDQQQNRYRPNSYHHSHHHHHHPSPLTSPYGNPSISEEELLVAAPTSISSTPGRLSIKTNATNSQHRKDDGTLLDSPIDEYIIKENGNNTSSDSANQINSDDSLDDTDSCSFESTDIPDPFLFPSDDGDNQHISTGNYQQQSNSGESVKSPRKTKTPAQNTTKKAKTILDEALQVRTSDMVSGHQVPVMQVNISHESTLAKANRSAILSPMSAVIESTSSPYIPPNSAAISIKQPLPSRQSSLPLQVEDKISSTSVVPLEYNTVIVESPATLSPSITTSGSLPISTATSIKVNKTVLDTGNRVAPNLLKPRQQEEADQLIRQGIKYLFGNKFTKAIAVFESKAESEPLHALVLGSMLLLKAMMTNNEDDTNAAMNSLTHAYTIAGTQVELSQETFDDTFSSQFSSLMASTLGDDGQSSTKTFTSNGILRAHVIKAESCLLMGLLQLTQETMAGYLKCGLNFRKACAGYTLVWKEYQRMGDQVLEWMDENTVSAVKFGVGTLHLLLSSLPPKIINTFSGLSWKTDKKLGFTLLKSVMAGQGTRSSFGSLMLLSYYSILSSSVPSIYAQESIQETIECLVAAQKSHPKSCFFLYYAARISRVARNVGLSTRSFSMATASTRRGAWAEVAMKHTVAYEVGLNHAMQLDWDTSAAYFEQLCCARDWSPAFCRYFVGACHEMLGQRQEAKDAFDEVPIISHQQHHRKSFLDNYVQVKVERYQYQDYQDLDSSLPGLELLLLLNAFGSMEDTALRRCLVIIDETCQLINLDDIHRAYNHDDDSEDNEDNYSDYSDSADTATIARYGTLLLIRCAVLNSLSRYDECIPNLDWILKNKHHMESEDWLLPFVYWEAGVTHWGLDDHNKSRQLWQLALSCTRYDFEFRMASRIHLAMEKCDELGVPEPSKSSASGRKRI